MAARRKATSAEIGADQPRFSGFLRIVVEASSMALVVAFIVSVWMNQVVFNAWGLSFRSLATTSDVLMSGLTFFFTFAAPGTSAIILASLLANLAHEETEKSFSGLRQWLAPLILLLGLVMWMIAAEVDGNFGTHDVSVDLATTEMMHALLVALGIAGLCQHFVFRGLHAKENRPDWSDDGALILTIVLGVGSVFTGIAGATSTRMQIGYLDGFVPTSIANADCLGNTMVLLWVGTEFSAVGCTGSNAVAAIRTESLPPIQASREFEIRCRRASLIERECGYLENFRLQSLPKVSSPRIPGLPSGTRGVRPQPGGAANTNPPNNAAIPVGRENGFPERTPDPAPLNFRIFSDTPSPNSTGAPEGTNPSEI